MVKKCIIWLLAAILLAGCSPGEEPVKPARRLIVRIDAQGCGEKAGLQRSYTDAPEMEEILNQLRLMEPAPAVLKDPGLFGASGWIITVRYSDDTTKTYHHRGDRYLSIDQAPWRVVEPSLGLALSRLLEEGQ